MILRGRKRAQHAICQRFACWFPALFNGVKFWCECREIFDAKRFLVSATELVDKLAAVRRPVVDEE